MDYIVSYVYIYTTLPPYTGGISNNRIGGVMVSMLASRAVNRGFESRSGQTKDYKIDICCFSAKHASLKKKIRLVGSESE
jgi:hypothetical protein